MVTSQVDGTCDGIESLGRCRTHRLLLDARLLESVARLLLLLLLLLLDRLLLLNVVRHAEIDAAVRHRRHGHGVLRMLDLRLLAEVVEIRVVLRRLRLRVAVLVVAHRRRVVVGRRHAAQVSGTGRTAAPHVARRRQRVDELIGTHRFPDLSDWWTVIACSIERYVLSNTLSRPLGALYHSRIAQHSRTTNCRIVNRRRLGRTTVGSGWRAPNDSTRTLALGLWRDWRSARNEHRVCTPIAPRFLECVSLARLPDLAI